MKKTILILVIGALPTFALAGGDHPGGHAKSETHQHESSSPMGGMSMDKHDAVDVGRPGKADNVDRTIEVSMKDSMRFNPEQIDVKAGETVRFVVTNDGKIPHEMVIGTVEEMKEHAVMMRANPTMKHSEPNMITLAPGQHAELIWQFGKSGSAVDFACLVPGHLEAGMKGKFDVE